MHPDDLLEQYNDTLAFSNGSYYFEPFGVRYRTVAILAYTIVFLLGITGNSIVIFTIYVSDSLHTSAYGYLASLACADLLAICTAVPEGLVMMAFTLERYIATCRPFLAQKLTLNRSRKITAGCWAVAFLYCAPWFWLAEVVQDEYFQAEIRHCQLSLSQSQYIALFTTDLALFYVVPLVEAMFVYWNIGRVLRSLPEERGTVRMVYRGSDMEHATGRRSSSSRTYLRRMRITTEEPLSRAVSVVDREYGTMFSTQSSRKRSSGSGQASQQISDTTAQRGTPNRRNVAQSLRILVATVLLFAICWLPFRGLLIYNSLVEEPWLDLWYVLFCKCMVFLNCCANPLLYTLLSKRFRDCVKKALASPKFSTPL
ncbi:hypothetical protein RvY_14136-2 [Ramazzottius varieornatus]|uniref:Thyrotropin-releasing hormone receptor n=1 Tax=Ramazzottius varieornatus TaxID=947166 RepID=A0A1D1VQB0_RAMVA|nr:hypothetical protein RvY_14136-2 [Ramazzottius varieornatus]